MQGDSRVWDIYLSLLYVKVQYHTIQDAPFQELGANISVYGTPAPTTRLSSIWPMKIKANEILLMHKMRMGKAHSSTWWHSINWWLLNSSLFVPAAALLDWDNMRVPVAELATGLSMYVCFCVCVSVCVAWPQPPLRVFWFYLELVWPAWKTVWIQVTTIAFKFKYFIQNSRVCLRVRHAATHHSGRKLDWAVLCICLLSWGLCSFIYSI